MPRFDSDGVEIAYESFGDGFPIVLVHGFASNGAVNWVNTSWVKTLNDAGYRAITIDNRGHGASEKLYDPEVYPARIMAGDVIRLTAHLGLSKAALIGYSMGARISAFAMLDAPERFAAAVFGGLGINMVRGLGGGPEIVAGLEAEDPATVTNPTGRQFRAFAERTGSDLKALAACMKSSRVQITETEIKSIQAPVLVAVGDEDEVGGDPGELASLMPQGEALAIKGRDHMRATGDPLFKAGALAFFNRVL